MRLLLLPVMFLLVACASEPVATRGIADGCTAALASIQSAYDRATRDEASAKRRWEQSPTSENEAGYAQAVADRVAATADRVAVGCR